MDLLCPCEIEMWFYVRICKAANHSIPDVNVGVLVQYEKLFFLFYDIMRAASLSGCDDKHSPD